MITTVAGAAVVAYFWYNNAISSAVSSETKTIVLEVEPGDSINVVESKLSEKGFLPNSLAFDIFIKLNPELAQGIKAGNFELKSSMNIQEILTALQVSARGDELSATIPEGLRYDEVADILASEFGKQTTSNFDKSEFLSMVERPDVYSFSSDISEFLSKFKPEGKNLEGFLYPDTYFFGVEDDSRAVLERLLRTLKNKLTADDLEKLETNKYSFYEILTVASMLEREALHFDEEPDIADVIYKRLEKGVGGVKLLQIDATLLYPAKDWKANAFLLKNNDNPYNTYKYAGLPPTPISNPGIIAIRAALSPKANDYYYYIHDMSGVIHFGRNLGEHEANISKYL